MPKMPEYNLKTHSLSYSISLLIRSLREYIEDPKKAQTNYPWAARFVCGYPVPDFQRPICWTDEQQIRFITSVWMYAPLGSHMVNGWKMSDGKTFDRFSEALLDGQQRLFAIERYILDQIAVPDENGTPCLWGDLDRSEQRRFGNRIFTREEVSIFDEGQLRKLYDLRNFSGVAHTADQRASA
ncbi:DUF262 domain-containing protein [Acidithiobacillus sp. MC6.1]|nr:DUF262 domain-containing protein [Acidithiobacillus sp. MC6.1]